MILKMNTVLGMNKINVNFVICLYYLMVNVEAYPMITLFNIVFNTLIKIIVYSVN